MVTEEDMMILKETRALKKAYREKFGEPFAPFNYVDFVEEEGKAPAQVYKEALEAALERDEPTRVESDAIY